MKALFCSVLLVISTLILSGQVPFISGQHMAKSVLPFPSSNIASPEFITKFKIKRIISRQDAGNFSLDNPELTFLPTRERPNLLIWDFNIHGNVRKEHMIYENEDIKDTLLLITYDYDLNNRLSSINEYKDDRKIRSRVFAYQDGLLTKISEKDQFGETGDEVKLYYNKEGQLERRVEFIEHTKFQVEYFYPLSVDDEVVSFVVETELKQEETELLIIYFVENDLVKKEKRFTKESTYQDESIYNAKGQLVSFSHAGYGLVMKDTYTYDGRNNLKEIKNSRTDMAFYISEFIYDKAGVFLNEVREKKGEELEGKTVFEYEFTF